MDILNTPVNLAADGGKKINASLGLWFTDLRALLSLRNSEALSN